MKKTKLSKRTVALLAAGLILLAGGGYTGTRAALNVTSLNQQIAFVTDQQNVQLVNDKGLINENNKLLGNEKLAPGKTTAVGLKAKNTSNAAQYVRVVIKKYWKDKDGNKITSFAEDESGKVAELDMISLGIGSSKWKINNAETTPERTVYYYKEEIASGSTSDVLIKDVKVSSDVLNSVSYTTENGVTTYTYVFDDYTLCIDAEAQAVQTHNGADAIRSVWGVEASDVGITVTD